MFRRALRPRVLVYGAILLLISVAFVASMAMRSPFKVDVIRDRGTLARIVDEGRVENVYSLQIMNTTEAVQRYRVGVSGLPGLQVAEAAEVEVGPAEARWVPVRVRLPADAAAPLAGSTSSINFLVERVARGDESAHVVTEKSTFLVPR